MLKIEGHDPCYVALIDSRTLQAESLLSLSSDQLWQQSEGFSIYALVSLFSAINRRKFILALNTHSCFECTVTRSNLRFTVGLYGTSIFGAAWSHLLVLSSPCRMTA